MDAVHGHDDALEPALARLTSRDAESRIVAEGGVAARVVSESEWRREAATDPGPWLHILAGDLDTTGRHRSPDRTATRGDRCTRTRPVSLCPSTASEWSR